MDIIKSLQEQLEQWQRPKGAEHIGEVLKVGDGIAFVRGLSNAMMSEMLEFTSRRGEERVFGLALNLEEDRIGVMVLGECWEIKEGDLVKSTGRILEVPVGQDLIGRVIDPLGKPLDDKGEITGDKFYPIEKVAPGVIVRQPVDTPLQTGIKAIDAMIPIGRGQRELIIGDRQTGKTALAIDTIINQKQASPPVICIYVAIGQRKAKIARLITELEKYGALAHTIIVYAGASEPASLSYLAPYAGAAIGEYFMDQGQDALVIYDDLSKHAWAYRQISLLLRRPPGREAYPGDIFYLHSRLLERAARLDKKEGGGSLTALPIIETQAGDVSAYIPTNVISITDGQIYLESDLFYQGIRPALNVGLSVSRVGSEAQIKAMKRVAGKLRLDLAQYRELAAFDQYCADLEETTRRQLERGTRMVEVLKQEQYAPLPVEKQVAIIYAGNEGYLDDISADKVKEWEKGFYEFLETQRPEILPEIKKKKDLSPGLEERLKKAIEVYKRSSL